MKHDSKILIIGGGIGGLAAGRALAQRGFDVHVHETVAHLREVGAGVQMSPNAVKVLLALGLGEQIDALAFRSQAIVGRDWKSGRALYSTPLAAICKERYGAEYVHMHRADLHGALAAGLPDSMFHLSSRCTAVSQHADGVVASFADGSEVEGDILIGADGIHSTVRASLFGKDQPRFTGNMCWRTVIPVEQLPKDLVTPDVSIWLGPNGHVVTYYVRGGKLVNVVAIRETESWVEESWNVTSSKDELIDAFAGWSPKLIELFKCGGEVFKWGLFDRDPMPQWTVGRISLMGDAAHPMLPFLAQGAAMALEDAYILARSLEAASADLPTGLLNYEEERRPRTSRVQLRSREQGKESHLTSPWARIKRDLVYRLKGALNPQATGLKGEWLYEYDATR